MTLTRALPMLQNFWRPLYGDASWMGHIVGVFIRFWWVFFGGTISILMTLPFVAFMILMFVLPFIPLYQLYKYLT